MANTKKYISLDKLGKYDDLIKGVISAGDAAALKSAKDYADSLAENYDAAGAAATAAAGVQANLDAEVLRAKAAEEANADAAKKAQDEVDALELVVAEKAAQADLEALAGKVGEVPADQTVMGIITNIQENAYDDTALKAELAKKADKTQVATDIADAVKVETDARVEAIEAVQGEVDALGYQTTGGCFIYRRSVAKTVFGTDDPSTVQAKLGGGSGNWEAFWKAAEECAAKGVAIISGDGDLWHAVENSSDKGWIVDDKLYIDPKREKFLDYSKNLTDKGWSNGTQDWQDAWFADMKGVGEKPVLGFFGPAWLINYTIAPNCGGSKVGEGTYGDWAVCNSPVGFFWGGTWLLANGKTKMSKDKKAVVKDIIEWITLDTSNDGLLYKWANGTLNGEGGTKDTVASGVVMAKSNGELPFLAGQNMFDYLVAANRYANCKNLTHYDEGINMIWRDQVRAYANGSKSRADAIKDFKQTVSDTLGLDVE